jgi:hypothetical protein
MKRTINDVLTSPKEKAPKKGKVEKFGDLTLEQHKRALGDCVKKNITVEKWCIQASTSCETICLPEVFEKLVIPHATSMLPLEYSIHAPVIVVSIIGSEGIGEVFGSSKITGGTRMGSWKANKMDIIYVPETKVLRCWWTMK